MEWRTLSWLPNYEISEFGDCRRSKSDKYAITNRPLVGMIDRDGYRKFKVTLPSGKKVGRFAHRLCCEAFYGPAPKGRPETAHWDGTRTNNFYKNLRWASSQENADDRKRHGRTTRSPSIAGSRLSYNTGEFNGGSKLTLLQAREIRAGSQASKEYAEKFGVDIRTVQAVRSGRTWAFLSSGDSI